MRVICHRGNIDGPNPLLENDPSHIRRALNLGFDVEVDVWSINGNYILGHDSPTHFVKALFLRGERLWCHAKNKDALERMIRDDKIHCFWHEEDDYTITSNGHVWVFPGKPLFKGAICVKPEQGVDGNLGECYAVCTDYPQKYLS